MLQQLVKAGSVDVSVVIRILDATDGSPETGVVTATAGLALEYRRELAASTAITESDLAALTTAHTDGGIKHIGNGYYRLDVPDAAFASGVRGVLIHGTVTGMQVVGCYVQLAEVPADVTKNAGFPFVFGTLSGTHSATTADLGTNAPANDITGQTLWFPDDNLSRIITSYNTGTGVATFDTVAVTLTNGDNWVLFPSAPSSTSAPLTANVTQWLGTAVATPTVAGVPEVDITHLGGTAGTFAAGIPEVKVASLAAGAITAAAVATGAIDADAIAADAVTEIQSGLATAAALATVDTVVDAILDDTGTSGVKVDSTTPVDATVKKIVATTLQGSGTLADPWRPV